MGEEEKQGNVDGEEKRRPISEAEFLSWKRRKQPKGSPRDVCVLFECISFRIGFCGLSSRSLFEMRDFIAMMKKRLLEAARSTWIELIGIAMETLPLKESLQEERRAFIYIISTKQDQCMADPVLDSGFVYDKQGFIHILHSTFFDVNPRIDHTVEEYVERILDTLVEAIEEQLDDDPIARTRGCDQNYPICPILQDADISSRRDEAARKRAEDIAAGAVQMNGRELFVHEPWVFDNTLY
ncbi:hypothetical protein M5K25_020558 [Dendrobium thyrsiflorum]|uniref:Uncharacterized protein n=1 Tax=Dendrobium thyrsiflorum TaxID=117978 RepID=A0ABD0UAB6_DENTH